MLPTEGYEAEAASPVPFRLSHGFPSIHYKWNGSRKTVNAPTHLFASIAIIGTNRWWFNVTWLVIFTFLLPASFGVVWFGVIPIWRDTKSNFKEKAVWAFVVNPGTYVFFSFMLTNVYLACLDAARPWRPFRSYAPILAVNYIMQVGVIGTTVIAHDSFRGLGLVSIGISVAVTLAGLRLLPHQNFDSDKAHYDLVFRQFKKIMITFGIFWVVLQSYIIANTQVNNIFQGMLTGLLSFLTFIFKKVLLALTDKYPLELAMVISGLWLENLVDIFITLAYPTATELGPTFLAIWLTRVIEDVAYLGFQLNIWFRFRVWIKGVLTGRRGEIIEEDLDSDDRGHSNQHPGYRRRQMRFLIWKISSRISSMMFFVAVIPILRFGNNKQFYPYTNEQILHVNTFSEDAYSAKFDQQDFVTSMLFSVVSLMTFFVPWGIIFGWMRGYHPEILVDIAEKYKQAFISDAYFGFVLSILISNVLVGVSSVQVYNRLYFF